MLKLYYARSGNSLRAAIALEECGLSFERIEIDIGKDEHKTPFYLALNPFGAVPVLVDADTQGENKLVLAQSGAIMLYVFELSDNHLVPETPLARAKTMQFFLAAVSDAAVHNGLIRYLGTFAPEYSEANQHYLTNRLLNIFSGFETALQSESFLVGEKVTVADFALFPVIHLQVDLLRNTKKFGNLLNWFNRMGDRRAIQQALSYAGFVNNAGTVEENRPKVKK